MPGGDRSQVVQTITREIVLSAALLPTLEVMCDSDFWNRLIDEKGGRYLHEQKQVNNFLSALSTLPQPGILPVLTPAGRNSATARSLQTTSSISAASSTRQFDTFIRSISKLRTLGEARRLRADIEREHRGAKASLANGSKLAGKSKDAEERLKSARRYLKRLDRAKLEIDARIAVLTRQQGQFHAHATPTVTGTPRGAHRSPTPDSSINLFTVLSDPSSLAYWLEYMDRRGRSRLVQFWLTVEGFKDPLEAAGQTVASGNTAYSSHDQTSSFSDQTLGDDVTFLYEAYFTKSQSTLDIPVKYLNAVKEYIDGPRDQLQAKEAQELRQAMLTCQKVVYEQMEEDDWPDFRKSELFLNSITDLARGSAPAPMLEPSLAPPIIPRPPALQQRQMTAPAAPPHHAAGIISQSPRLLPSMVGRTFVPTISTPSDVLPTTQPSFNWTPIEAISGSRKTSDGNNDISASLAGVPISPPQLPRRSSHLDFLISGDIPDKPEDRGRLFDEEDEALAEEDEEDYIQVQRMEAIQAALNEIIASDSSSTHQGMPVSPVSRTRSTSASIVLSRNDDKGGEPLTRHLSRSVEDLRGTAKQRTAATPSGQTRAFSGTEVVPGLSHRASLSTLLTNEERPSKLFDEDTIGDDLDAGRDGSMFQEMVQLAAPGDLQLSVQIARLQARILDLVKQEHLLDTLRRQADLTGNQTELRILHRSQNSVRREQRTAIFQKAQFEQQEEENRLVPARTHIAIPSSMVTTEYQDGGKHVVRYTVEIEQIDEEDGTASVGWAVARRYNEFWELDRALRELGLGNPAIVQDLKRIAVFPPKKLVPSLSSTFVESRRVGLERYLQSLLTSATLWNTSILNSFLSRSPLQVGRFDSTTPSTASLTSLAPHNIVKSLYNTMATSLDDALVGPSMLDLMYTSLSRQLNDVAEGLGAADLTSFGSSFLSQALNANTSTTTPVLPTTIKPTTMQPLGGESAIGSFTTPICDLFIEVFDLRENNWLRRMAIVVILQQFLGGTIERKVRDSIRTATSAESIERTLATFQETLWSDGEARPASLPRNDIEKGETRMRASKKLGLLIPDVAANMIGPNNARRAARTVFGALQDRRLNEQLVLAIMDEVFGAILPGSK